MTEEHFNADEDEEQVEELQPLDMDDMDDMEDKEGDDMGEMPMEEEADLEENSTTAAQYQKTGMAAGGPSSAGKDAGYGAVGGKGSTGYDAGSKALQERFQKLANIIKG